MCNKDWEVTPTMWTRNSSIIWENEKEQEHDQEQERENCNSNFSMLISDIMIVS